MPKKWMVVGCCAVLFLVGMGIIAHKSRKPEVVPAMTKKDAMAKAYRRSEALVAQAVADLKVYRVDTAVPALIEAISVFPANTEAYKLLVKAFLATRQELRLYQALESAGRSYPSFDDILKVVDTEVLAMSPLLVETADAYIAPFKDNKNMAMSFMFDDGESSVYTEIMPLFEKYNYRATISVVAGGVVLQPGHRVRGSWPEWKDAAERGFEIANHSMEHRDARTLKPEDLKHEIDDAKDMIEQNVGKKVYSYVFPFDRYSPGVLEHVIRTHPAARQPDYLRRFYNRSVNIMYGGPKFSLDSANRLVDIGISRRLWLVAECHGLTGGGPDSYKPLSLDFIEQHLSYIRRHSQEVWVDTFGGVFEYLFLRRGTQIFHKNIAKNMAQIVLHNVSVKDLPRPLTVVLKVQNDVDAVVAQTPDGASLKAWPCGMKRVCVNVAAYDQPVRIAWRSLKP